MKDEYCNKEILDEAAEKSQLPKFLLKKMELHWHSFVLKTIESGNFENVLVPFLVKFEFKQKRLDAINYKIARAKAKQEKQ